MMSKHPDQERNYGLPTFLANVKEMCETKNSQVFATWYNSKGKKSDERTFGQLWAEAGEIAKCLRHVKNINKGDRVILCYNFGLGFIASFLGCLRAGVTAVLMHPPNPQALAESLMKVRKVSDDCDAKLVLMDTKIMSLHLFDTSRLNFKSKSKGLWPLSPDHYFVTDKLRYSNISFEDEKCAPDDIAFLQYTSGSTGNPKGVMVSFGALAANVKLIQDGFRGCYENDGGMPDPLVGFSWLPQHHDLGLIYATLVPLAGGWRMHFMSPLSFLACPLLWLELMSRLKVSWGVAPDFAYQLVVKRFKEKQASKKGEEPIPSLDLSSLHYLKSGAEPIRLETKDLFTREFRKYNLRENWFFAGYGLAENVVGVCWIHSYETSSPRAEDLQSLVAVGCRENFHESLTIKIVDPDTLQELPDEKTGELVLSGPSVAKGYWKKPDLSKKTFEAELNISQATTTFLRTGDLAFFQNDKLFICGRIKDLIVINGVNFYPQDIELAVQNASEAVRPGCVAAFSKNESSDDGTVEVVFELRKSHRKVVSDVIDSIQAAVNQKVGLEPARIVAISERTIPKTTSGKIQRRATRAALHDGQLTMISEWNHTSTKASQANFDSDVVVVGAGIVGLCFARDMASLGYHVTVVEKSNAVGGTWATNDYPGLRLHAPGCSYRCISVAPLWTKGHAKEEFYRPTRKEVFDYCQQLSQHKNINILLESHCPYEERQLVSDKTVIVKVNGAKHKTRYVFASTGCFANASGLPVLPAPFSLGKNQNVCPLGPVGVHSSNLNGKALDEFKRSSGRKVIIGSGKGAIDMLQIFERNSDNVIWAHRGHTYFVDRSMVESSFQDDGIALMKQFREIDLSKWKDFSEQSDFLISCSGPMSSSKLNCRGGICSREELAHADSFKQFHLHSMEDVSGSEICLKGKEYDIRLRKGDAIIFCTGQSNQDWNPPALTNSFARSGPFTLSSAPLNAIIPLCVASDVLCGKPLSRVGEKRLKEDLLNVDQCLDDHPVVRDFKISRGLVPIVLSFLGGVKSDIAFMNQWQNDWYGKDMDVEDVLAVMRGSRKTTGEDVLAVMRGSRKTTGDTMEPKEETQVIIEAVTILSELKGRQVAALDDFTSIALTSMQLIQFRDNICDSVGVGTETFPVEIMFSRNDETKTVRDVIRSWLLSVDNKHCGLEERDVPTVSNYPDETERVHKTGLGKGSWLLQLFALFIPSLYLALSMYPALILSVFLLEKIGRLWTFFCLPILVVTYATTSGVFLLAFKWTLIGQLRPHNSLHIWSWKFACRWVTRQCMRYCWMFTPWATMGNTAPLTWLYRCLGCEIGTGSTIALGSIEDPDLVVVGDGTSVKGTILTSSVSEKFQHFDAVRIGSGTSIQDLSFVSPGAQIGCRVVLITGSSIGPRIHVPDNTEWEGKPAKQVCNTSSNTMDGYVSTEESRNKSRRNHVFRAWQMIVKLVVIPCFASLSVILLVRGSSRLRSLAGLPVMLHLMPLLVTVMKLGMNLSAILMKWLLLGHIYPGEWPLYGSFHCRKYLVDSLFEVIELLDAAWIFAPFDRLSIIRNLLLRANGTTVDWLSALWVNDIFTSYDLARFSGKDIFFGGSSYLSPFEIRDGMLQADNVTVENHVIVGTTAILRSKAHLVSGSAVGQLSVAKDRVNQGQTVLGTTTSSLLNNFGDTPLESPSYVHLHLVQVVAYVCCWAFFSICVQIFMVSLAPDVSPQVETSFSVAVVALSLSGILTVMVPILGMLLILLCRYVILPFGHKEGFHPIGSFRWYQFGVNACVPYPARGCIFLFLGGTSLEVLLYSLLGCRFDTGTYVDGCKMFEPDLVTVGKDCVLDIRGGLGSLSPHDVTRDGVHIRRLNIGDSVTVSPGCQVKGGQTIENNVTFLPFSGALTDSTMRCGGTYNGYPCERVDNYC